MKNLMYTIVTLCTLASAVPALAQQWYWFGPYDLFPADSRLSVVGGSPSAAARFVTTSPGDLQWAYMGLDLPANTMIDSVAVCYQLLNTSTFISDIRFSLMGPPDVAQVYLDLGTDQHSPTATCVTQAVGLTTPTQGMFHLGLRLNFASVTDYVEIGAIGVLVETAPSPTSAPGGGSIPDVPRLLGQNAPNPFNPGTKIAFELPHDAHIELGIYDVQGKHVATLFDGLQRAGRHEVTWNGRDDAGQPQASGVYLYRLQAGDRVETQRMTLVR